MKKAIALILAVTLGLLLVPSAVTAAAGVTVVDRTGDGEWTNNTWEVEIYPGEEKATIISLRNSSSSSLGVEVTIFPALDNGNLTFELDKSTFTMPGKGYADVTLSVKANGSATPGTHTAELEIKSAVPPAPPKPKPPIPEVVEPEEPEVIEPEPEEPEPVVPEPEEPEVVEPEEPTEPEEPEVIEPEEEPEVAEPEEEEEVIPYVPPEKPGAPWGLIGGLAGGLATAGGIGYWLWRRRRKEAIYGDS